MVSPPITCLAHNLPRKLSYLLISWAVAYLRLIQWAGWTALGHSLPMRFVPFRTMSGMT